MRYVAYHRVSTKKQGDSTLGLQAQQQAIESYVQRTGGAIIESFTEVETGTSKRHRPVLAQAIHAAHSQKATLVISKLDRLARNVTVVNNLMNSGVDFVALDIPQASRLTIHIFAAIAEWEAERISTRIRDALAVAKQQKPLGTTHKVNFNTPTAHELRHKVRLQTAQKARTFAQKLSPTLNYYLNKGLTTPKIADELNNLGIETPSGRGKWHATQVLRCLKRAEIM